MHQAAASAKLEAAMLQNRISLLKTEDNKMIRKIEETRRMAEKIKRAKEQKDKELEESQLLDEENHKNLISKKLKVIEDRKVRIAATEMRLKTNHEIVARENFRRREEAIKAKAEKLQQQ